MARAEPGRGRSGRSGPGPAGQAGPAGGGASYIGPLHKTTIRQLQDNSLDNSLDNPLDNSFYLAFRAIALKENRLSYL